MKTGSALILTVLALASFAHCGQTLVSALGPLPMRARLVETEAVRPRCRRPEPIQQDGYPGMRIDDMYLGCRVSSHKLIKGRCYPQKPGYECDGPTCHRKCHGDHSKTCSKLMCALPDNYYQTPSYDFCENADLWKDVVPKCPE